MTLPHRIAVLVALAATAPAVADDGIPPDTLAAVKRATVYVQAQGTGWKGTGSGFVVAVQRDAVLIATNHHVIAPPEVEGKPRPSPSEGVRQLKQVNLSVVFDPGTKDEATIKAEPIAADPVVDLAVLRVALPKVPPAPIPLPVGLTLTETMPVYVFGFPFGQMLALTKGAPAITIGKGSVSSLRLDDTGELAMVQIDGALNPGNSGGPVVDSKGRLAAVAVATIKGSGIGMAIPAAELGRVMKGRLGSAYGSAARQGAAGVRIRVEVDVVDPTAAIRGVTLYCLPGATASAKPVRGETLAGRAGVKSVAMKITDRVAVGEIVVDGNVRDVALQAVPDGGAGADGATRIRVAALGTGGASRLIDDEPGVPGVGAGLPPPPGWKEYRPKDNRFAVWIPARSRSERADERNTMSQGRQLKSNVLTVETATGLTLLAHEIVITGANLRDERAELETLIRDLLANEVRGRVTQERNVTAGEVTGKEYRIEAGAGRLVMRLRVFVAGSAVVVLQAVGATPQADTVAANTFLTSCRLAAGESAAPEFPSGPGLPVTPGPGPSLPPSPGTTNPPPPSRPPVSVDPGRRTHIHGGFNDPEFLDEAPAGGLLVGVEVGVGQFINTPVPHAVRPIYRVDDRDTGGEWYGPTAGKQIGRTVARPGYAVGAITVVTGLTVNGFSMTFMKVVNGRLDPKDSYESEWLGGPGGGAKSTLGGDGTPVVGLIGKAKRDAVTGLGLLFAAASAPTPTAPEQPGPTTGVNAPQPQFPDPPRPVDPTPGANPDTPGTTAPPATAPAPAGGGSRHHIFLMVIGGVVVAGLIAFVIFVGMKNRQLEEEIQRKIRARRRR